MRATVFGTAPTPRTARMDILPANVMLNNMRRVYGLALSEEARQLRLPVAQRNLADANQLFNVAQTYAVDAAPYYHPKLATLQSNVNIEGRMTLEMLVTASIQPTLVANQNADVKLLEGEASETAAE